MEETNTQIAWPSKLKIGAKSKKGILFYYFYVVELVVKVAKPQKKTILSLESPYQYWIPEILSFQSVFI